MRLRAAIRGDLRRMMENERRNLAVGIKAGVREETDTLKDDYRKLTAAAGLPAGLQRAWRSRIYPKGASANAAGYVFSKAPRIHAAFATGGEIRARNGRFLVVPLPVAIRLGLHRSMERSRGSRPRRWSNVAAALDRFGALRMVKLSGGRFFLVADNVTSTGRRSRTRRTREGLEFSPIGGRRVSMPLFLLVPRVRLGKRLDLDKPARSALGRLASTIVKHINAQDGPDDR